MMSRLQSILLILLLAVALLATPRRARAQVLPAAAGTVGGFVAGTIVMTGVVVLEARMGHYIYGLDDFVKLRPEILPIIIGPIAGGVLGVNNPKRLQRAGVGALVGLASGAALGTGVAAITGASIEGRWAGGIIGGAAGMLAGSIINASRSVKDGDGTQVPIASMSIKVPWGR